MTGVPISLVLNLFTFLAFPFVFASLAKKAKMSPVVGYIAGGLILGNVFGNFFSKEAINDTVYFGIALFLFTVGLEINFSRILILKKYIVIGGFLQILLSVVFVGLLSLLFGFSFLQSFLIGIALSSSSTALVAKIIQDKGGESSFIGEIALGILMFQDIAFIPFLMIFTSITNNSLSFFKVAGDIVLGLIKSGLIIVILYYLGQKLVPKIFDRIAASSRELLNLFIIIFIVFITYLSLVLKIPILIGIFAAGVLVAQTLEHYHIFSQVRPFRDLLAIIFFIFIGSNITLGTIAFDLPRIIAFTAFVVVIKALVILLIFLAMRFHTRTAFALALYLFQIDEGAFILMSLAFGNGMVSYDGYLFIITSMLLTLIVTPSLIQNKDTIYLSIRGFIKKRLSFLDNFINCKIDRDRTPIDAISIENHVIVCGYGRVGRYIGRSLMLANIPFIAIDYDFHIVEKAKKEGVNIIYGDPSDRDILDYSQAEKALVLILAVSERVSQELIIMNAKKLNPGIVVISRVHKEVDQKRMKDLGVNIIIQPEFEASISIIKRLYYWNKLAKDEIVNNLRRLRLEHGL